MISEADHTASSSRHDIVLTVILAAAAAAVFAVSVNYPFLPSWDDPDHISANARLALNMENILLWWRRPVLGILMPATMYSYMFDHLLWGLNPTGYHLQNMFWHIMSTILIFRIMRHFNVNPVWAFAATMCWTIHPQRVESVVWLSERKDVMCAALSFASLLCYLKSSGSPWLRRASYALYLLALLSKPMAVSIPFIIVCIDFFYRRDWNYRFYLRRLALWLPPALALMWITTHLQVISRSKELHLFRQLRVILHNLFWYPASTIWPAELSPIYPRIEFSPGVITAMVCFYLLLAAAAVLAWRKLPRRKVYFILLPGLAAFCFAIAPVVGFFQIGFIDRADRYSYIPSALIWFYIAAALPRPGKKWLLAAGLPLLIYIGALVNHTVSYQEVWKDYPSIIRHSTRIKHPNDVALIELGLIEFEERNYPAMFRVAGMFRDNRLRWQTPADWQGQEIFARYFEGKAWLGIGKIDEALAGLEYVAPKITHNNLSKKGIFEDVMIRLYLIHDRRGNKKESKKYLRRLVESFAFREKNFTAHFYSGILATENGDFRQAEIEYEAALRLAPDNAAAAANLREIRAILQAQTNKQAEHSP